MARYPFEELPALLCRGEVHHATVGEAVSRAKVDVAALPRRSGQCSAFDREVVMHRDVFERTTVLALAALVLLACGKKNQADKGEKGGESEAAAPVQVEAARRGPIDPIINVDAVLHPVNYSNVMAKISAPVERVMVNRGDHVHAGQLLAQLENRDLTAAVGESRGQLDQAQAAYQTTTRATVFEDRTKAKTDVDSAAQALDAARRLYENRVALRKEGAVAQNVGDDARVATVQAQSTDEAAQRQLDGLDEVSQ